MIYLKMIYPIFTKSRYISINYCTYQLQDKLKDKFIHMYKIFREILYSI